MASFATPFIRWDCATRTYCEPTFNARFPYNAPECGKAMPWWEDEDDRSAVELSATLELLYKILFKFGRAGVALLIPLGFDLRWPTKLSRLVGAGNG